MVVRAGTNPDNNIQMVNNPNLMENDSDQDGPCFFIPADCGEFEMIHITSDTV